MAELKTKQRLVASRKVTSPGTNGMRFITIHETANTRVGANAEMHAQLQLNGFTASWHWQVDDKQAIQSFPHTVRCWHAGDGAGNGNFNSIGVEICVNSDGDFAQAVRNAAMLVRKIMKDESIPIENVVQHNRWSGKNCPTNLRNGSKGVTWAQFMLWVKYGVENVQQASNSRPSASIAKPSASVSKPEDNPKKSVESLAIDGYWGPATTRALQRYFGTTVDGVISGQYSNASTRNIPSVQFGTSGSLLIKAMQRWLGVKTDGWLGPITVRALQKRLGTAQDGVISRPSLAVREMQRRLNSGTL